MCKSVVLNYSSSAMGWVYQVNAKTTIHWSFLITNSKPINGYYQYKNFTERNFTKLALNFQNYLLFSNTNDAARIVGEAGDSL